MTEPLVVREPPAPVTDPPSGGPAEPRRRIIEAAQDLALEQAGLTFTVQQVVDRAGVALQTFYRSFGSKDGLILALLEKVVQAVAAEITVRCAVIEDPIDRLRTIFMSPTLTPGALLASDILVCEHLRLLGTFPREVERALSPYRGLLVEAIVLAQGQGQLTGIDPEREAAYLHWLVTSHYHRAARGSLGEDPASSVEHLWEFSLAGLRRNEAAPSGGDRARAAVPSAR